MKEIVDAARAVGRGWWLVLAAAVISAGWVALNTQPELIYRTEALVGVDPNAGSSNDRIDFSRNLEVAITSSAVVDAVAESVGVDASVIEEGLLVQPIGDSNLTRVVFDQRGVGAEEAEAVVMMLPTEAAMYLRGSTIGAREEQVGELNQLVGSLETDAARAREAVNDAITDNENIPPNIEMDALQRQLADLRARRLSTDAADDAVVADQLDDAIEDLEERLTVAAVKADSFRKLTAAADEAEAALARNREELASAEAQLRSALLVPVVSLQENFVPIERFDLVIRSAVAAGAVAAIVVLLGVAMFKRFQRGRAARHVSSSS